MSLQKRISMVIIGALGNYPSVYDRVHVNTVGILKSNEEKTSLVNRAGRR